MHMKKTVISVVIMLVLVITAIECVKLNKESKEEDIPVTYGVRPEDLKKGVLFQESTFIKDTDVLFDDTLYTATITSIGDIMLHSWQINRGYDSASDSFDFAEEFEYVTEYLSHADFTVANLETTFAGRYNGQSSDVHGYADYPCFNSPEILADNIKDTGIDFVGTANNHSLDSRQEGIYSTLDYLDDAGLLHTGTARSEEEKNTLCIYDINGIKFGFCAYTYALNGFSVAADQLYSVNSLELYSDDKLNEMYNQVRALKDAGADFVLVMIHFGTEYKSTPDENQIEAVEGLIDAGADVILGSHPHVIEPMDIRNVKDENGNTRTVVILYSQGNFVSSQIYRDGIMKDIGMITDITFTKQGKNLSISEVAVAPTYTYWNDEVIGVVPVLEAYYNRDSYAFLSSKDWGRIEDSFEKTILTLNYYNTMSYTCDGYRYYFRKLDE